MPPQLTRYLYFKDECFYSLMFCLIQKSSFDEVIFWAGEVYYSGFHGQLWDHIWKIYYDFHAIKYPKYEKKINKLSKETTNFKNIVYILNLFYYSKPTYTVFALRMLNPLAPTHVYMGKIPKWLKELELKKWERKLIRSIHNNKKINSAFYIKQVTCPQSYNAIKKYYIKVHGLTLKNKPFDAINYKNKAHILLALVCHLSLDVSEIQMKTISKKIDKSIMDRQIQINSVVEPLYKTLFHKRLFKISPLVGAFKLERFSIQKLDYKDILRLHWDYFAYNTPLWQQRIKTCNGIVDNKKYELVFKNDDDHDAFYERFNYEPDEQSKEIQEKSICDINVAKGQDWLCGINDSVGIKKTSYSQVY